MLMKGALHTHSTCSDGQLSIVELIDIYQAFGFDFIALTDHDFLLPFPCYEKQLEDIETDLLIFKGIELSVFEKGYLHINRIIGEQEELYIFNHPAQLNINIQKVIERINLVSQKISIDAVEITSEGYYTPEYDIPEIAFPKIATDDSHDRDGCCRAWIEVNCDKDRDTIIRKIKRGEFENHFINNL